VGKVGVFCLAARSIRRDDVVGKEGEAMILLVLFTIAVVGFFLALIGAVIVSRSPRGYFRQRGKR
jgi:hypothetical protein